MFGLLMGFLGMGVDAAHTFNEGRRNNKIKENTPGDFYVDTRGVRRLKSNDERVQIEHVNGDLCLTAGNNNRILVNYDQQRRNEIHKEKVARRQRNKEIAINLGWDEFLWRARNEDGCMVWQETYEDIATGRLMYLDFVSINIFTVYSNGYKVRSGLFEIEFLTDTKSHKFIRKSSKYLKEERRILENKRYEGMGYQTEEDFLNEIDKAIARFDKKMEEKYK